MDSPLGTPQWVNKLRLFPAISLAIVLLLIVPSTLFAKESKPGDLVYPVKRFWEEVRVVTTFSNEAREMLREAQVAENVDIEEENLRNVITAAIEKKIIIKDGTKYKVYKKTLKSLPSVKTYLEKNGEVFNKILTELA